MAGSDCTEYQNVTMLQGAAPVVSQEMERLAVLAELALHS